MSRKNQMLADYMPSLSELLEQCGDNIEALCRIESGTYADKVGNPYPTCWEAYPTDSAYYNKLDGDCVVDCCGGYLGSTPEEAVQKLLDALNNSCK